MPVNQTTKLNIGLFLPGRFMLARGTAADYQELSRFHYCGGRPGSWVGVWVVRYEERPASQETGRVVAVGVLSNPPLNVHMRSRYFGWEGPGSHHRWRFINDNIRTISRVVVHPQFRCLGLSTLLVREMCRRCPTRYVESIAVMGRFHPFFERAGMRRIDGGEGAKPISSGTG